MPRRTLAEPKTAFAGVTLEISFARFRASIAPFKKERVLSRPFRGGELVAIVDMVVASKECGENDKAVRSPHPNGDGRPFSRRKSHVSRVVFAAQRVLPITQILRFGSDSVPVLLLRSLFLTSQVIDKPPTRYGLRERGRPWEGHLLDC